ncbi:hypothetical protein [Paraburkholderia caffeinilytica]|uniref:Uncharacterized protein n=1 Tax=Paraburkholderia caffeinilytica TaxID=1761016 RepID=A0ABQ1N7J2_9BURK|nr:hypothetical protein [Paraburkholderia caffeinilytica]GGC57601.1 hypothetical protein GCM10011400_51570 [Paraburkholderia caffeinilytica]CAB3804845.1 hypothetical protein LMG28690_06098 [Paraburkholderia caffeinilytica]
MKSYRCYYLMKGEEPSALRSYIQVQAADAVSAAQQAMHVTGCVAVTDVVRVQG